MLDADTNKGRNGGHRSILAKRETRLCGQSRAPIPSGQTVIGRRIDIQPIPYFNL